MNQIRRNIQCHTIIWHTIINRADFTFYFKNVFAPPFLELEVPQDNQIVSDYNITVQGKTEPESELKINNNLVLIDQAGAFSEGVHLKSGINIIEVSSKKKYSRERIVTRKILVEIK